MERGVYLDDHLGSRFKYEFSGDSLFNNYVGLLVWMKEMGYYLEEYTSI
jgi:hypothetical protein